MHTLARPRTATTTLRATFQPAARDRPTRGRRRGDRATNRPLSRHRVPIAIRHRARPAPATSGRTLPDGTVTARSPATRSRRREAMTAGLGDRGLADKKETAPARAAARRDRVGRAEIDRAGRADAEADHMATAPAASHHSARRARARCRTHPGIPARRSRWCCRHSRRREAIHPVTTRWGRSVRRQHPTRRAPIGRGTTPWPRRKNRQPASPCSAYRTGSSNCCESRCCGYHSRQTAHFTRY